MQVISPRQPFRLNLMKALASITEDPDADLPDMLAEGVHAGIFSDVKQHYGRLPNSSLSRNRGWRAAKVTVVGFPRSRTAFKQPKGCGLRVLRWASSA